MAAINLRSYEHLSPFEIKDELIRLARTSGQATAHIFLNAGRGNPNWIATRAREIFFLLGQFALDEARRVMAHPAGIGGMPRAAGIADRLHAWLDQHEGAGAEDAHALRDWSGSAFSPMRSCTNSSTRSSATTTPFRIACSFTLKRWCTNT